MKRISLLFVVLLLAAVSAPAEELDETTPTSAGMGVATLYIFDNIIVVYPENPKDETGRNRASARRRADLLETAHGVSARIVSDGDIGEKELSEHLLVLGWNNRLLQNNGLPVPFKLLDKGFDFLGITAPEEEADLIFYHTSPFDQDKKLVFWSRIDPELDRARILPTSGSDWAVFIGYRSVAQGNFEKGHAWPPVRNPGAEIDHRDLIAMRVEALNTYSSAHYNIRYNPETFQETDIERIAASRETAYSKAIKLLGDPGDTFRIDLTVHDNTEDKLAHTEVRGPVHSVARDRRMHMTPRYAHSTSAHEELHIIARKMLGPCYSTAIYEGLSFSFERTIQSKDLDLHAAIMEDQDRLPLLADLLNEERLRSLPREIANPASGLMMSWLRSTTDHDEFRAAYTLEDADLKSLGRVLGVKPRKLERSFKSYVGEKSSAQKMNLAYFKATRTARDHHLAGDYEKLAEALKKALESKPGDPETTFTLAAAQMHIAAYTDAERNLEAVLRAGLPPGHKLTVFGHFQMGRLFDLQERREEALAMYRKVLELPDLHNSHRSASELIETPFTRDRLE